MIILGPGVARRWEATKAKNAPSVTNTTKPDTAARAPWRDRDDDDLSVPAAFFFPRRLRGQLARRRQATPAALPPLPCGGGPEEGGGRQAARVHLLEYTTDDE
jgi:hypothetical protein